MIKSAKAERKAAVNFAMQMMASPRNTEAINRQLRGIPRDCVAEIKAAVILAAVLRKEFEVDAAEGGATNGRLARYLENLTREQRQRWRKGLLPEGAIEELERFVGKEKPTKVKPTVDEIRAAKHRATFQAPGGDLIPRSRLPGDPDDSEGMPSPIDFEMAALSGPEEHGHGGQCTPCWKCLWWDRSWSVKQQPSMLADPEIREAQRAINERKAAITQQIDSSADNVRYLLTENGVTT